jgi:hypothetical protein
VFGVKMKKENLKFAKRAIVIAAFFLFELFGSAFTNYQYRSRNSARFGTRRCAA